MLDSENYRITVERDNVNEPGASIESCEVGFYIKDYIGHSYRITNIVSTIPLVIDVYDELLTSVGPQQDRLGFIYKTVGDGEAPIIAPIDYSRLDSVALDYSRAIELDIIWQSKADHDEVIAFAIALG